MTPTALAERTARPSPAGGAGVPRPPDASDNGSPRRRRRHPWRRRVLVVLLVLLTPLGWSYYRALTYPGSASWQMRSIEWLRTHGAGGTVDDIEVWLYSRHRPPTSGVPTERLPEDW